MFRTCLIFCTLALSAHAEISQTGEIGLSVGSFSSQESYLNPGNRVFENASMNSFLDARAELKWLGETSKIIIRPRWTGLYEKIEYTDGTASKSPAKGKLNLTDFYGEWSTTEKIQYTVGLFVDGWGPAEFVNPSNAFFHLDMNSKSFFFKEKGHVLAKAVYNPVDKTTFVFIAEPISNNESAFREGQNFQSSFAARFEWQSDDASQLFGMTGGRDPMGYGYVGEYIQFRSNKTGASIYVEARHTKDPERFDIVNNGVYNELLLRQHDGVQNYSVLGLRWEGRVDARAEWIHYDLGYSEDEWNQLLLSITTITPAIFSNAGRFRRSGLELLTKNWLSFSLRIPDIGPWSDWSWSNRFLFSMGDSATGSMRGGLFQTDLEAPVFQSWNLFFEGQNYFGQDNTELTLSNKYALFAGARWAW